MARPMKEVESPQIAKRRAQYRASKERAKLARGIVGKRMFWQWGSVKAFREEVDNACARFWENRKKPLTINARQKAWREQCTA